MFYANCSQRLLLEIEKNKILLGLKKEGFGLNKWTGLGGKVEHQDFGNNLSRDEAIFRGAIRYETKVFVEKIKFVKLNELIKVKLKKSLAWR